MRKALGLLGKEAGRPGQKCTPLHCNPLLPRYARGMLHQLHFCKDGTCTVENAGQPKTSDGGEVCEIAKSSSSKNRAHCGQQAPGVLH